MITMTDLYCRIRPSVIGAAVRKMLATKARSQGVSGDDLAGMQFAVSVYGKLLDVAPYWSCEIQLVWRNPYDTADAPRNLTFVFPGTEMRDDGGVSVEKLRELADQVDIRGELCFFRLLKHFPKKLKRIYSSDDGKIIVEFKNGRTVESHQSLLDDKRFLAECVMVHDL